MTMIKNEQLKHGQQEKWFNNFHENLDLNVTAQELEQQPDFRWELLENRYSQYSELSGKIEKHRDSISLEAQQQGNQIPQTKISEACVNDLLILAQSAEIVAQSEDSVAGEHTNNQKNKGKSGQSKNLEFIMIDFIQGMFGSGLEGKEREGDFCTSKLRESYNVYENK